LHKSVKNNGNKCRPLFCVLNAKKMKRKIKENSYHKILKDFWGYHSFLPFQEEIISSILAERDTLSVLPTGAGKSLCFQLPALIKKGMAVVISPLISLMKDQVDDLRKIGIDAYYLNSSLTVERQKKIIALIREEKVKLLYISPERLEKKKTINLLKSVNISFFVIDEAHCISQWGHDFRLSYRNLKIIKKEFPKLKIHAFTATATPRVQLDINQELGLENPEIFIAPVDRQNLIYWISPRKFILDQIIKILEKHPQEAGIIYCLRRRDVDNLSKDLLDQGIDNVPYHAGLKDEERKNSQEKFIKKETNLVIATIAFGMGINRPDIRFIIHAGLPQSIEHYQQQTGRAGRDGLSANCYLFYSEADYQLWRFFAEKSPNTKIMVEKLNDIYNFCLQPNCRHKMLSNYFGQKYGKKSCQACDYCLKNQLF